MPWFKMKVTTISNVVVFAESEDVATLRAYFYAVACPGHKQAELISEIPSDQVEAEMAYADTVPI